MAAATRSKDFLLSTVETIEGSKLPSGEQVLGLFLHRHRFLKDDIRTAATYTIEKVEEFWVCGNIPVKHRQDSIKKLEKLFDIWKGLKKNNGCRTEKQQSNEVIFSAKIAELFDIAHGNALDHIDNEEDKAFLLSQRKRGRPGYMGSVDQKFHIQQMKLREKEEKLRRRRSQSEVEKQALMAQSVLVSSSDEDSSEDSVPTHSCTPQPAPALKRGRQTILSPQLAAMLDRNALSDRAAMMIIFEASRALGQDPEQLILNRSTINRQRKQFRESAAADIKESFKPTTMLTVHWHGKLMCDLTGNEKVDRLPILVSTVGEQKLLAIPKLATGTGQVMAQAVFHTIKEWQLETLVRALCFDTTSFNTGRHSGACVVLEGLLGRRLLHFGCRHHILELVLASAFAECIGPSSAPEILLFKRFRDNWTSIDQTSYSVAASDDFVTSELVDVRSEIIDFCELQLQNNHPRADYRELITLLLVFLGATPADKVKFRAPGPMHLARWMSKAIYSLKVWLFRGQFKLTARESRGLLDMNIFLARVYVKFWFLAPKAHTSANNDLVLLQQLHAYPQRDIASATSRKLSGQLWYLSEDLILLSLFDPDVDISTKRAMLNASKTNEGDELDLTAASLKRAVVDLSTCSR